MIQYVKNFSSKIKLLRIVLFVESFFIIFFPQRVLYAQIETGSFKFEGVTRNYMVFLPNKYPDTVNLPLVIYLHGYDCTAQEGMNYTKLNEVADTSGFIVVYPSGGITNWNSGMGDNPFWPTDNVNDVGFISKLIDAILCDYDIDLNRVYACGYSNGGFMSYKLACELSNRIAAIASVGGVLSIGTEQNCNPLFTMPVLQIHGTADHKVPINGTTGWKSVDQTLSNWIDFNSCVQVDTILLPDLDPSDDCSVEKISFTNCLDNSNVIYYKVINGGHTWPGAGPPVHTAGNTNQDISASVEIWNFFKNYGKSIEKYAYGKSLEISHKNFPLQGDTFTVSTKLANPEYHPVTVFTLIDGQNYGFQDSIELFDDGLHSDGEPNDKIYANSKWLSGLQEDMYSVELFIIDLKVDFTLQYPFRKRFTTAGPVELDSIDISRSASGFYMVKPYLHNMGKTTTITNASVQLICYDPWVKSIKSLVMYLSDIPPDSIVKPKNNAHVYVDSTFPGYFNFNFEVMSDGMVYWQDSMQAIVTAVDEDDVQLMSYKLEQNYPNPFNPSTSFRYSIPKPSIVIIKVYDILGNKIETLVNEEKPAGTYTLTWKAANLPSGVYFYRFQSGSFLKTKKMILLR